MRVLLATLLIYGLTSGGQRATAWGQEPQTPATRWEELDQGSYWENYQKQLNSPQTAEEVTQGILVQDILEAPHDYTYASFGKPNPFIPPMLSTHLAKLEIPIVSVLQRYSVDQLQVVGIWTMANSERKALIMTSKDEGVIVQIGDPIGNRGGKVVSIEPQLVKIREFNLAPDGTRQFEDIQLWLGNDNPNRKKEETIVISSQKVGNKAPGSVEGQDYLESTEKQQARKESLLNKAVEGLTPSSALPAHSDQAADDPLLPTPAIPPSPPETKESDAKGDLNVQQPASPTLEE